MYRNESIVHKYKDERTINKSKLYTAIKYEHIRLLHGHRLTNVENIHSTESVLSNSLKRRGVKQLNARLFHEKGALNRFHLHGAA